MVATQSIRRFVSVSRKPYEPSIITRLRLDEEMLEGLKMGIAEGRIRLKDRVGPLGYYEESIRLRLMLLERGYPCVQIAAADGALARYVALDACADAGMRMGIHSGGFRSTNHRALASELNKIASRLRCDAILVENVGPDDIRLLAKAALMSRPSIIAVYEAEVLPDSIYLDPRGKASSEEEWYARIAVALSSAKGLINGLDWEQVLRIGRMASAFRGVTTIERFLDMFGKTGDASQALRETYSIELDEAFTPAELQLLSSEPDVETLHERYTAMIRQIKPGADPELEWARFYERLRRLGLVEVREGE